MLQPEAERHAGDEVVLQFAAGDNLGAPDDEVVEQHAADHREDHAQVEAADPAHSFAADVGGKRRINVDLRGRELFGHAGVALAARTGEIGAVNGGTGIARREDAVRAVAARAIGDDLRTSTGCQSVIAGQISSLAASLYAEFLRKTYAFMAAGAGSQAHVLRRDRGIGIVERLDGVNAVAVGADGRLPVSLGDRLPVDAPLEFFRDLVVTAAAS